MEAMLLKLCCAVRDHHVDYLPPILMVLASLAEIGCHQRVLVSGGLLGALLTRLKRTRRVRHDLDLAFDRHEQTRVLAKRCVVALCFK